jgi:DNA-binding XRE family transcriptional regulator
MTKRSKGQPQEEKLVLRQLRESAGLTQEEMAHHLGIASSTYRRWEKGLEPAMTRSQWIKYCKLVSRSFEDLPDSLAVPAD